MKPNDKKFILTGKATLFDGGIIKRGEIMLMKNQIVFIPGFITQLITGKSVIMIPVEEGVEVTKSVIIGKLISTLKITARKKSYDFIIDNKRKWIETIRGLIMPKERRLTKIQVDA